MVSNIWIMFHFIYGMSSKTHWRTPRFFKMVIASTTNQSLLMLITLMKYDDGIPWHAQKAALVSQLPSGLLAASTGKEGPASNRPPLGNGRIPTGGKYPAMIWHSENEPFIDWLVVWNMNGWSFPFSWESSSQLTNSIIFQRGRSTTNQEPFIDDLPTMVR